MTLPTKKPTEDIIRLAVKYTVIASLKQFSYKENKKKLDYLKKKLDYIELLQVV